MQSLNFLKSSFTSVVLILFSMCCKKLFFNVSKLSVVLKLCKSMRNIFFFFDYLGGRTSVEGFSQSNSILKMVFLVSLWHLATSIHCFFVLWKIDPAYCTTVMSATYHWLVQIICGFANNFGPAKLAIKGRA